MTGRQRLFARSLAADPLGNATKAALIAGCPQKSARQTASKWLQKPDVQAELENERAKAKVRLDVREDRIIAELARIAFMDLGKCFKEDGTLLPIHEMDEDVRRALSGLDHEKLFQHFGKGLANHVGTTVKIRTADKLKALELLGKWTRLSIFEDKKKLEVGESLAEIIEERRKAVASGQPPENPQP